MAATVFIPGVHNNILVKMFLNKASADVFFQVGNGSTQIPAHRTVLSEASEEFKMKLEGKWAEVTDIAEMTGVEENVFRSLLIFIYKGGEIDFETRYLLDVLKLARSFLMQDMVDKIISQEVFHVYAPHHVWSFLSFAVIAGDEELQNRCLTLIDSDAQRFLSLPAFQSVGSPVIILLVGRNTLGITELELFNFLISWSESNCQRQGLQISAENQRRLMQDFLFDIRYSLMSLEDVSQVEATNILTLDEMRMIRTTIRMNPTLIPVPPPAQIAVESPAQSSASPSLMLRYYGVTLSCFLVLLVILLSVILSNRNASGSSGTKTTALALDQIQKELDKALADIAEKEKQLKEAMTKIYQKEKQLEEAMTNIDQKEKQLEEAMGEIDQKEEVIGSLDQELSREKDEAERDRDKLKKKINDLAVENEALKAAVAKDQNQKNSIQPVTRDQGLLSYYWPILCFLVLCLLLTFLAGRFGR